ncbi:MAG: polyphosphate:AMP phosphotransferase [Bacillota bacterium]
MGDHDSDAVLQPDMHLKPLDNSALLKPLRKAPDKPAAVVSPTPKQETHAAPKIVMPAAAKAPAQDDDDADFTPVRKPELPKAPPVPAKPPAGGEGIQPKKAPAPDPIPPAEANPPAYDGENGDAAAVPAPRPAPSFRPTDEQMHMMELMKTIFASALNASLSTGRPQDPAAGQPPAAADAPPDMDGLRKQLIALQQKIREAQIPVVIVIEGLSASGKGTMLSRLIEGLDARGYKAHPVRKPNCVEQAYPPMWRYWTQMPAKGNLSLFCSSWYGELNKACFEREDEINAFLPRRLDEIISMESQLLCDGTLILKFFLHISRQEQYDRLRRMENNKSTAWQVDAHDHEQNKRYDEYMRGMDNLMSITNLKGAPWHILDATDLKDCTRQMYLTVIRAFEDALREQGKGLRPWDVPMLPNLSPIPSLGFPPLRAIDLNRQLETDYDSEFGALKKRLYKLQVKLYRRGIPVVIGFEGWDAAGKGGAIRRLNAGLDARGFTVAPIGAPTPTEQSHHYLWRFFTALPPRGHITIFDRTWYGRVMVERVEQLCTQPQWQRAYEEINRFEKLLTDDGAILCKFFLQIDPDTQLQRFNDREADPEKRWKITDDDWRNREKWPAYEQALDEVLQRTHTAFAPWTVIEADDKEYARIKVLKTVIDAIEKRLGNDEDDD